jgi:pyruvate dehydrogenase E2 component (dihydrolipoamide acetyltransferase)
MDIKLPHLGEGADSGTVVNVFVKEGDTLAKDQPILELENEKAVATIPSTAAGVVTKIHVKSGDKVTVGQRVVTLGDANGSESVATTSPAAAVRAASAQVSEAAAPSPEILPTDDALPPGRPGVTPAAAPSIRKLARELGIDLTRVRGSEAGGRIVLADVRNYIERLQRLAGQPRESSSATSPTVKPPAESIDFAKWGPVSRKPLSPLRQVIARRMTENWNAVPRVTQFDEADVTALMEIRKQLAVAFEQKGARLTLTSFALQVVAQTLRKHPVFNSSLDESTQEIVFKDYIHVGIAVDTEAGLIVPVIRDVDRKDLLKLSLELEDLAKKARDRKVAAEELKGGTFTISNQGGIGSAHFTPIVNRPEVAILGLGRSALKPVVRGGKIEPRMMLPLALSYDHRVIDGGLAARFMVDLVAGFESTRGPG